MLSPASYNRKVGLALFCPVTNKSGGGTGFDFGAMSDAVFTDKKKFNHFYALNGSNLSFFPYIGGIKVRPNLSGVGVGAFHLDFEDGEIRYESAVPLGDDGTLTPSMVRDAIMLSLLTMDKYFPALMSVVYAGLSPADALAVVRNAE